MRLLKQMFVYLIFDTRLCMVVIKDTVHLSVLNNSQEIFFVSKSEFEENHR